MNSNEIKNLMRDLQDLHNRLVANYNDNVPFEQLEEDRLVVSDTLDLINQYEVEIEGLSKVRCHFPNDNYCKVVEVNEENEILKEENKGLIFENKIAKAEARKEFAERFDKAINERLSDEIKKQNPHLYLLKTIVKDLLKEMGVE